MDNIVWYTESYPPYNYRNNNGALDGLSIVLLKEMLKVLSTEESLKNVKLVPWARGYKIVSTHGLRNILFSTTRIPERENMFKWVGPIVSTRISVFGLKNSKLLTNTNQFNNFRFVVIREDIGEHLLKKYQVGRSNITRVSSLRQAIGLVFRKRVDFLVYDENVLQWTLKKYWNKQLLKVYEIQSGELWFAANKSIDDNTIRILQDALVKAKRNIESKVLIKSQTKKIWEKKKPPNGVLDI